MTNWTLCLQTHSLYLTKEKKLKKFKFKDAICFKLVVKILNFCHLKWPLVYITYAHLPKPRQCICKLCFNNGDLFSSLQQYINNMIILIFHFSSSRSQLLISLCSILCLVFHIMFQFCFKKYHYFCWRAQTLLVKQVSQEHKVRTKHGKGHNFKRNKVDFNVFGL